MAKKQPLNYADYTKPLSMNGLNGRVLSVPTANKNRKRQMLLVYGHHASLERVFGFVDVLREYGTVTVPDMPGFGGMDPLYKIKLQPTIDNLADYLASFIKMRYKNQKITIIAMSLGFAVTTRMLQKYPEINKNVNLLISFVGIIDKTDIGMKRRNFIFFKYFSTIMSNRLLAGFAQHLVLRAPVIKMAYKSVEDRHSKLQDADAEERKKRIDFEVFLWQCNDFRTYAKTGAQVFNLDLKGTKVDQKVYGIFVEKDRYLNKDMVEINMKQIYTDFEPVISKMPAHAPTVIATAKDAAPFVPSRIRQLLRKPV